MPSSNIHLKVANELNKRLNINSLDFIVGNIAPDSVNINGFAPKEVRWTSHLRDKDYDVWIENIKQFYDLYKDKINNQFLLGYVSHALTDVIHDKYLYMKQRKQLVEDTKCMDNEAHNLLRDDMDNYTFKEFSELNEQLKNYENKYEVLNVKKDELNNWIRKVLEFYRENTTSKYQTEEDMEFLIKTVGEILKEIIYKEEIKYK